ncbi:penicillin-binding protein 1C [Brytella acorum]|uniref:penicillin-binding protein 1C n=1 Tax=Brytella acorum TaxID=2959299 RepID=UPI0025AE547C|nr:penicillin-binding protein 1C [Brytella acorum]MDF3625875.1 penicillin-binding protein 1C [Brytella acorum]
MILVTGSRLARRRLFLGGGLMMMGVTALGLLLLDRLAPPDLHRARDAALLVEASDHSLLDAHTSRDGMWRLPLKAANVDPGYLALLMKTEDHRFEHHPGVDPQALGRALWQIARRGHVVSGGSTLAMQVARLLTPHPHTWTGKIRDIFRALQLEWRYGRSGVLDLYLTLAPEGRNIEGIRAASLLYFGHEPDHLSTAEAAILVTLPRRPSAFRPDRHPQALRAAARRTLARAALPTPDILQAPAAPEIAHLAPELLGHFLTVHRDGVILTTLDSGLQRRVRDALTASPAPLRGTFAALVVNEKRQIVVWIGGAEHDGPGHAIDGVLASRSPGSTLKPFIYGMAFEKGWMTPRTRIRDVRLSIGGYAPLDFDRAFRGETTVSEALQLSLNVPAIQALRKVGPKAFMERLAANGATLSLPKARNGEKSAPSLAIALGGVDLSLHDLTMLYTALDHQGRTAPLQIEAQPATAETMLLTPRAAADIRAILRGTAPPEGVSGWNRVAFKTGTSYGNRDGWAMASTPQWTVGIWAGRPDGTASPGLTGRDTAGPVLAEVLALLSPPESPALQDEQERHRALATLSPALRKLSPDDTPQIIFPRDHAEIESRSSDGTMLPVGLEASGGHPPYRWFVNGMALDVPPGAQPAWTPDAPGFAHLALADASGAHMAVEIRVR